MSGISERLQALAERVAAAAPGDRPALLARLRQAGVGLDDLPVPVADRAAPLPASETILVIT